MTDLTINLTDRLNGYKARKEGRANRRRSRRFWIAVPEDDERFPAMTKWAKQTIDRQYYHVEENACEDKLFLFSRYRHAALFRLRWGGAVACPEEIEVGQTWKAYFYCQDDYHIVTRRIIAITEIENVGPILAYERNGRIETCRPRSFRRWLTNNLAVLV